MYKITSTKAAINALIFIFAFCLPVFLIAQAVPEIPGTLDPTSKTSLGDWWTFIYTLVAPIATFLVTKFWPATTKKDLLVKAFVTAILVLVAFVVAIGAKLSAMTVLMALIGLIGQKFVYDNVMKPFNIFQSKKSTNYKG